MTSREVILRNIVFLSHSFDDVTQMLRLMSPQFAFPAVTGGASHLGHILPSLQVCVYVSDLRCIPHRESRKSGFIRVRGNWSGWSWMCLFLFSLCGLQALPTLGTSSICSGCHSHGMPHLILCLGSQPWGLRLPHQRCLEDQPWWSWALGLEPQSLCDKTLQSFSHFPFFFFVPLAFDSISGWSLGVMAN